MDSDADSLPSVSTDDGQIQVIFGPMFSGKTTELMRRLKRYQISRHKCLVVKYANDNRYDDCGIATHDKQVLSAVSATVLDDLRDKAAQFSVIGIDEGQFFPDTVEFAESMANRGKVVIVAALDATYQRKGFGNILELVPLAESVVKLTAVCMVCYEDAAYTKRTSTETAVEVIGGADKYIATCRKCYTVATPQKRPLNSSPFKVIQENGDAGEAINHCKRKLVDEPPASETKNEDKENSGAVMA